MKDNFGMDKDGAEKVFGGGTPAYSFEQDSVKLEKEEEAELWGDGSFRLFISHIPRHKDFATSLKNQIARYNIAAFVAHPEVAPTALRELEISYALFSMDALVAVVSRGFHDYGWTNQEVGVAIGLRKKVIPINFVNNPLRGFLGKLPAIPRGNLVGHKLAKEIILALYNDMALKPKIGACILHRFERASNISDAEDFLNVIEQLDYLPESLITRLENAASLSSNISRSLEVSKRLPKVIVRLKKALKGNFS